MTGAGVSDNSVGAEMLVGGPGERWRRVVREVKNR